MKTRRHKILIPIAVICIGLIFSCNKKYQKNYIQGTISENDSNTPIANATVILRTADGGSFHYDSVYTDSEGKFNFPNKEKKGNSYCLIVRDNAHFRSTIDINSTKPPYDIAIYPFAYLKLRIKKNSADSNKVYVTAYTNGLDGEFNYGTILKHYAAVDTILPTVIRVPAKKLFQINHYVSVWPFQETNWSTRYEPNVSVNKGDTLTYFIQCD